MPLGLPKGMPFVSGYLFLFYLFVGVGIAEEVNGGIRMRVEVDS
jgi:hypothetical protein